MCIRDREPRPKYSDGVQLSLLDLWGMTEEVSQQPKTAKKKKEAKKESSACLLYTSTMPENATNGYE